LKHDRALVTNDEMQTVELNSEFLGVSHFQLMEAVGSQIAREVAGKLPRAKPNPSIIVFAGAGKNGGDGFSAARHLASRGLKVRVTLVGKPSDVADSAAKQQLNVLLQMSESVEFESCQDSSQLKPFQADIIVDALLGTGVRGDLRQPLLGAVRALNKSKGYKISIDLPSGLDTDTGEPHGEAVVADLTLSLHRTKVGVTKNPDKAGEVVVLSIGIPPEAETFAGPGDFKVLWKPRPPDAHKGDFGRLVVIGGSEHFTGAPTYAAMAATKLGTDLVYVAGPSKTAEVISSYSPDLITIKLPGDHLTLKSLEHLEPFIKMADALVIGPGIGLHEETQETVWRILSEVEAQSKPVVVDADALKILGRKKRRLRAPAVLTPHAGEFSLLAQRKISADMGLREEAAVQLSEELGATVILKGKIDIIANGSRVKLNRTGNPYMTVGGTGDVLTGIIGGLLAQHVDTFEASVASAFLNGLAGDLLVSETGPTITASALVNYLPKAMKYCVDGPPYPSLRK